MICSVTTLYEAEIRVSVSLRGVKRRSNLSFLLRSRDRGLLRYARNDNLSLHMAEGPLCGLVYRCVSMCQCVGQLHG